MQTTLLPLSNPLAVETLRIARYKLRSRVLGPGERAVVWFQGCSLDCPGCIAAEMNRSTTWLSYSPTELVELVSSVAGIEGVTLSGGDPFDQPKAALIEFLRQLRALTSLSVMCYTGRTLRQLESASDATLNGEILSLCDILIDGVYDERRNDGHQWRGSSNQEIHFLTDRYRHLADEIRSSKERAVEVDLSTDKVVSITGIPAPRFLERLRQQLAERGIEWSYQGDDGSDG